MRTCIPDTAASAGTIHADLEIEFAGQTAHYKDVACQAISRGVQIRVTGTIPAKLSDFKIDPPSLLTMPVKNDIPIKIDIAWRPM